MSVNHVILVGNVGQDPESRVMGSGDAVCNVSLATNEKWKDKNGEQQERTEWHRLVFFRKLAEIAGKFITKGMMIYVEGKLRTRKWQDKDGQDRYTTEIEVTEMKMLGSKADKPQQEKRQQQSSKPQGGFEPSFEDDIPFN